MLAGAELLQPTEANRLPALPTSQVGAGCDEQCDADGQGCQQEADGRPAPPVVGGEAPAREGAVGTRVCKCRSRYYEARERTLSTTRLPAALRHAIHGTKGSSPIAAPHYPAATHHPIPSCTPPELQHLDAQEGGGVVGVGPHPCDGRAGMCAGSGPGVTGQALRMAGR